MCKRHFRTHSSWFVCEVRPCFDRLCVCVLEISETTTSQRCHGELFRTLTRHSRKYEPQKVSFCAAKKREAPHGFVFSRLLLFGNPLDCVCENLWIKLRLLEEADGQDLQCTDDSGESHAFITLTPPDCGNVTPSTQPNPDGVLILNMRREKWQRNL